MSISNSQISELLARAGEEAEGHRRRAYERAAGHALMWPDEARTVLEREGSLTTLDGVGPSLGARIARWLSEAPEPPEPPPSRRGFSTYAHARRVVAEHPEWRAELRADFQMHTTFSDGKASVRDMGLSAAERGYGHIAITDHSKGLKVARGMDEARLAQQSFEIARVNDELEEEGIDFHLLHGIELNLGPDGGGDMEPESLRGLDLVVGSFHSQLRSSDDQTARYLAGLLNPAVDVIGHPSCRRFNRRPRLIADWERVFSAAAGSGRALEINSHPHRQDLSLELLQLSAGYDLTFSIGTDAHSTGELRFVEMSLAAAIETGIDRERIINFWPRGRVLEWCGRARRRARVTHSSR